MDDLTLIVAVIAAVVIVALVAVFTVGRKPDDAAPRNGVPTKASALGLALRSAWGGGVDDASWIQIEEALLAADVGAEVTARVIAAVRKTHPESAAAAKSALATELRGELGSFERDLRLTGRPGVILVVGVNGTGKTTTIAKLAKRLKDDGLSVVLAAADTFRAAAGEQLKAWASRVGVDVVAGQDGGDPAAVVFDAMTSARAKGVEVVIIDTAGRLHGKKNLMAELAKIYRVAARDGQVDEVLLVLDGSAGQNGLAQVREFTSAVPVSGVVLTKLDGTARGGIVIAVEADLGVPVKLIGVGEGIDDLHLFDPDRFVDELLEDG